MCSGRVWSTPTTLKPSFASAELASTEFTVNILSSQCQTHSCQMKATFFLFQLKASIVLKFLLFKVLDLFTLLTLTDLASLELSIKPVLEIFPQTKIYEGDPLNILCTIRNLARPDNIHLYLSQGIKLLSSGNTKVNHSIVALASEPGDFECRLEMGNVAKVAAKTVLVTGECAQCTYKSMFCYSYVFHLKNIDCMH